MKLNIILNNKGEFILKDLKELANIIFYKTENTVYEVLDKFENNQNIDKSLTYTFFKAFYIHVISSFIKKSKKDLNFDDIYTEYKNCLSEYYKKNNSNISEDLLKDLLESFDKCFEMIESLNFIDIDDGYEFRHHIISAFELLKMILESKSKIGIRQDIFENYISKIKNEAEEIMFDCN